MTQEAKLKKIIEKAEKSGWEKECFEYSGVNWWIVKPKITHTIGGEVPILSVLFSKSFAVAIWGEGYKWFKMWDKQGEPIGSKGAKLLKKLEIRQDWQYHLQQAVLSDNPIDYYCENL